MAQSRVSGVAKEENWTSKKADGVRVGSGGQGMREDGGGGMQRVRRGSGMGEHAGSGIVLGEWTQRRARAREREDGGEATGVVVSFDMSRCMSSLLTIVSWDVGGVGG
ncbi:hypothetical protein Tco_0210647 [Tanacetum coccineum]